jgi:hypothetical protein
MGIENNIVQSKEKGTSRNMLNIGQPDGSDEFQSAP